MINREFLSRWIDSYDGKPGTVKTYLGAVQLFFKFCVLQKENLLDIESIKKTEYLIKQWKRNLWKNVQREKHAKSLDDLENMPTKDQMEEFDQSAMIKFAIAALKSSRANPGDNLNRQIFCLARNYLISSLILDNSTRPGTLSNMTLKEFSEAKKGNNGYVVAVHKHKTDYNGPAMIAIDEELYDHMHIYLQ